MVIFRFSLSPSPSLFSYIQWGCVRVGGGEARSRVPLWKQVCLRQDRRKERESGSFLESAFSCPSSRENDPLSARKDGALPLEKWISPTRPRVERKKFQPVVVTLPVPIPFLIKRHTKIYLIIPCCFFFFFFSNLYPLEFRFRTLNNLNILILFFLPINFLVLL